MNDFELFIKEYFSHFKASRIKEAMYYSLAAGGKRFRPSLIFAVLEGFKIDPKKGYHAALALEMVHTYSLIHDDLPAMDDDDYRRGKPSCHKAFDEATAILAGDGLLSAAFKVICDDKELNNDTKAALISDLSELCGANGMIYGQCLDLEAEASQSNDIADLYEIDDYKTGCLFKCAMLMGMRIAKDEANYDFYDTFAHKLGRIFQMQDDLFDIIKTSEEMGKPSQSDLKNAKLTALNYFDKDKLIALLNTEFAELHTLLDKQNFNTEYLKRLVDKIKER